MLYFRVKEGGDLLSHLVAVPSALTGLTSLFGMVRGGPRRHGHLSFKSAAGSTTWQLPLQTFMKLNYFINNILTH